MHILQILLSLFILPPISSSVPFKREDTIIKDVFKNERRFPNGSVIGTYSYKDDNGNPVYVKYYADDSNYGVELKSVRIMGQDSEQTNIQDNFLLNTDKVDSPDVLESAISMSDTLKTDNFNKNNSYNPYGLINSNPYKKTKGHQKSDDEYEIFLENIMKPNNKYNKEKVRIYIDKNRRKVRNNHN